MSNEIEPSTPAEQVVLLSTAPDGRDVTAELAAPPRRRLPWVPLVLSAAVIATAAFAGGVWYQRDRAPERTSGRTVAAGGGAQQPRPGATGAGQNGNRRNGQGSQGGQGGGQGAGGGQGGFTRGTVKAVDGTTVYLTDANGNTVKVTTGDSTKVQLNKEGKVGDLQPGQSVTVVGTPSDGGYAATQLVEGGAAGGFGGGAGGFGGGPGGGATRNPSGG
ncbi:hypothetical protein SAMN05216371_4096 [Streptomyces sp. TLI_053]|uniref:hypothetical protein n=1 Tax=Streptomyces sp. TLI_053 TaxID=1855352 RepID=UPI00087926A4|nr:hypothetical protein [Streptomyces sp. TLI_053]SDT71314.1 hypothetical protein SAMN05216371_4096 [Streptomyces sp. TLI_053]